MRIVLLFSQQHTDFRLAEVRGICRVFDLQFDWSPLDAQRAIFVVDASRDDVEKLLERSLLLKSAYELFDDAPDYEALKGAIASGREKYNRFNVPSSTFSVRVRPVGKKKGVNALGRAKEIGIALALDRAPVDLDNAVNAFTVIEEYIGERATAPERLYLGRLLGHGQFGLKNDFALPERIYIGNTTMDPELAFIQCNVSSIRPADVVVDPFCGTGGLLIPAARFGALVTGTEINYQIAKGVGRSSRAGVTYRSEEESCRANFEQYGLLKYFLGLLMGDSSRHDLWRRGEWMDAIVADPPYGVREKGRKIGYKERKEHWTLPGSTDHHIHFPEKQRYATLSVYCDLMDLAASRLRIGGRVSFWFPIVREEYSPDVLPVHPALRLVENCEQTLTLKTSRRLLCYEKVASAADGERATAAKDQYRERSFRDVFFNENSSAQKKPCVEGASGEATEANRRECGQGDRESL